MITEVDDDYKSGKDVNSMTAGDSSPEAEGRLCFYMDFSFHADC